MNVKVKLDMTNLQRAMKNLAPQVKKSRQELVQQAAKGFVKTVAEITPPASKGKTGTDAKKQGEQAIIDDFAKAMLPVRVRKNQNLPSARSIYDQLRDKNTGRLRTRGLRKPTPVAGPDLRALRKEVIARVGWLAAGWNAAAQKLGVNLPAWIKRHGTSRGIIRVINAKGRFRIEVTNAVKFVGNVKDLDRRMQKAVDYQAGAMQRQADHLLKKAVKDAGFTD